MNLDVDLNHEDWGVGVKGSIMHEQHDERSSCGQSQRGTRFVGDEANDY